MFHIDAKVVLFLQVLVVIGLPLFLWRVVGLGRLFPLPIIQIFAGIVLGPSLLGWLAPEVFTWLFKREVAPGLSALAGVETLANVAVVLFIFLAGCEADRGIIRKSSGVVLKIGLTGVFLPWILGTLAALAMVTMHATPAVLGTQPRPILYSVAFGLCMAVSALPVLVIVLRELGFNTKPIGSIALAIAGIDDALLWASLTVILPFAAATAGQSIVLSVIVAIAGGAVVAGLLAYAITPFLERLIRNEAPERLLMSSVILALFLCAALTEATGLHAAIGAFLTGLLLPDKLRHLAQDRLDSPVTLLLLPFLFLSTGLKTNFSFSDPTVWVILLVAMVVCVGGKFAGITLPGIWSGQSTAFSLTLGALMQCKGLMEIVVVTILYQKDVIGPATFSALILTALISTALTVPMARLCLRTFGEAATTPLEVGQREAVAVAEPGQALVEADAAPAPTPAIAGPALVFDGEIGVVPLAKQETVIGRHSSDDLRLNDVSVSRHHARLRAIEGGRFELDNLTAVRSEPNPVLVNGVEREHAVLQDGDVVRIGGVQFRFHQGSQALAA